ncbi:MAG: hypothetical protein ACK5Q5_00420 [Planctomycetaceae bacterium]
MHHFGRLSLVAALVGTVGSTLGAYPHQLAYFNEAAGGPANGWRHLLGSSFDCGQDTLFAIGQLALSGLQLSESTESLLPVSGGILGTSEKAHRTNPASVHVVSRQLLAYLPHSRWRKHRMVSTLRRLENGVDAHRVRRLRITPTCDLYATQE